MNEELKDHVTDCNVWMRLLFMALFGIAYAVSRFVLLAVVVIQFLWLLFTGSTNPRLLALGSQLATFIYQILRYLTFNTETRPFPFADWPDESALIRAAESVTEPVAEADPVDNTTDESTSADEPITDAVVIEEEVIMNDASVTAKSQINTDSDAANSSPKN
ncbi:MAG: DUF4389 domain-containing protein [Mariprofundus sp.]